MTNIHTEAPRIDDPYRPLYRLGAWAALITLALIPVQGAIFAMHPPPATVLGHFASLNEHPLLGLVNLDLLYLVTMLLMVLVNVAVYGALRRVSPAWMLLALVLAMLASAIFFASGAAFEMLTLSHRYDAAATDAERTILLGAGEAVLARYQGTAYDVSYVLSAFPSVIVAMVMLRSSVFRRATAWFGLFTGVMMVLPPTVGLAGMIAAFASLVPLAVWLVLVALRLFRLGGGAESPEGGALMKAAICTGYGPPEVLVVREVEKPQPRADELLVRVHASTVNSSDWFIRSGIPQASAFTRMMMKLMIGVRRPRRQILGLIVAGEVVEVGAAVRRFRVGDRVWAFTKFHLGGYAEYTCLREQSTVGLAPAGLSFDEIAAIAYGGLLALHYVHKGGVKPDMQVLLYGASSGVGTAAVQIAKHLGAEVTAVCGPENIELVRSLGADHVLDYTKASSPPEGARYDLVLDTVGKRKTSALRVACEHALRPGGRVLSVDDGTPELSASGLTVLKDLAERGALKPVIDRRYPLEQIAEAHRYVEQDHKKGNVVISLA